jgi:hypothetical protein
LLGGNPSEGRHNGDKRTYCSDEAGTCKLASIQNSCARTMVS